MKGLRPLQLEHGADFLDSIAQRSDSLRTPSSQY
jgi:hypothetical protein